LAAFDFATGFGETSRRGKGTGVIAVDYAEVTVKYRQQQ
jgi:hypothetical protein